MNCRRLTISSGVRCAVSCVFVLASQLGLAAVARFAAVSSLIEHVAVSGALLAGVFGFGRFCKRLLGVKASATASVILHLLFVWGVYLVVIRRVVSMVMDVMLNLEIGLILFGMWRMMRNDPGWVVAHDSILFRNLESETHAATIIPEGEPEDIVESGRIRRCKSCKLYVKGFDHHCPAFENCIDITTQTEEKTGIEMHLSGRLAISTMTFCLFQVTWEVLFLAWHIYCICNNIRTDEWINWTKYPEFHREVQPFPGHFRITFYNPYNKGVLGNLKEFCYQRFLCLFFGHCNSEHPMLHSCLHIQCNLEDEYDGY